METMTTENAAPRLSAWEIRERMKSTRNDLPMSSRRGSSARSNNALHNIDSDGLETGLPAAFRSIARPQKQRSKTTTTTTLKPTTTFMDKKSAKKLDSSSHTTTDEGSMELKSEASKTKFKSDFKIRKKPVFDAISKYVEDDSSTVACTDDIGDKSTSSYSTARASLGSQPPVRQRHTISGYGKTNPSLDLSMGMGVSEHTRDIQSSSSAAADERWARFKLLGRLGLGDIEVPEEAKSSVERNIRILQKAIKNIVALRDKDELHAAVTLETSTIDFRTGHLLDEVERIIELPTQSKRIKRDPESVELGTVIQSQLEDYMTMIYSMYRTNPFHNFDHASHVLKAVNKLVSQVVAPDDVDCNDIRYGCGVNTDPWTQFALIFSALIHDVDHCGVPNAQLIKEKSSVAGAYKNKSVAEQNSIELAWNLFMEPCYKDLRECIFKTQAEMIRFRGLVVTAVMATDIADKELAAMRKGRAEGALGAEDQEASSTEVVSRKATFVLETLVQAADVSHTMEPFKVYKRWNHRLYKEMYTAYKSGRAEKDPTDAWYKGEFGFFDFYIIPLARKLKSCGVGDKACDDWLNNAIANRKRWEAEGEAILAGFVEEMQPKPKITLTNMASMHSTASCSDDTSVGNSFHEEVDSSSLESDVDISVSSAESSQEEEKKEERRIAHSGRISASVRSARVSLGKKATKAKTPKGDASKKKKPVEKEKEEPKKGIRPSSVVEPLGTERVLTKLKSASLRGPRTASIAKLPSRQQPSPSEPPPKMKIIRRVRRTKSDDLVDLVPEKAAKRNNNKAEKSADNKSEESSSDKTKEKPAVTRRKSNYELSTGTTNMHSTPDLVKTRRASAVKTEEEKGKRSTPPDTASDHQKSSTSTSKGEEKPKRRIKRPSKPEKKEKAPAPT
jgi:hypothetical protein